MRIKFITILIILFITGDLFVTAQDRAANEMDTLTERLKREYLSGSIDDMAIDGYIKSMQADGSWKGFSLSDSVGRDVHVGSHLDRVKAMTVAFVSPRSSWYHSTILRARILDGLESYYRIRPVSWNWWQNSIGFPQSYMISLILLKGNIGTDSLNRYASLLKDETGNERHRGKNRSWISAIVIHKGCIENNRDLVTRGFQSIASTIVVVSEQGVEGIKSDYSFHQHHEQIYSGGYGLSILTDLSDFMELSKGTTFSNVFTSERRKLFGDLALQGHQRFGYRNTIDFGTTGRNISRPNSTVNISGRVLDKMMIADPANATDYRAWKEHLTGAPFPVKYQGNRYFWKSDIMTQHGADYYLSAKVISRRTLGTESLNGENFKGFNLPMGATNIKTNGNEYLNIFPVWDWTRIPGTTAALNQDSAKLDGYIYGSNDFGGGTSDGNNGLIAYEHNYKEVKAKKMYFFSGNTMYCMGSGIVCGNNEPIATSVNQCLLSGKINIGRKKTGVDQLFNDTVNDLKDLAWVYHDNIGYLFPEEGDITLKAGPQTGSWKSINRDGSAELITKNVFSLWFNHGVAPNGGSYQYVVVPDMSLAAFKKYATGNRFRMVRNDADQQAVTNNKEHVYAIVFYRPGAVDLKNGLLVTSDRPALVLISRSLHGYKVTVADPLCRQESVKISLAGKEIDSPGATIPKGTGINFIFPKGDLNGRSVSRSYEFKKTVKY